MRLIFGEFPTDYQQYHFPYQVLAFKEKKDNLAQIYYGGWLPFRSLKDWFYLARSTRVRLSTFSLSSENRRILRKIDGLTFTVQPIDQFNYTPQVQKLAKQFADQKFGLGVMSTAAIRQIFTNANTTHIITFVHQSAVGSPIGYVAVTLHEHFLHYAHPFYDLKFANPDLGLGMMLLAIIWAKEQHKQFIYLGTCYSHSALYKTQFSGFEFFNGWQWSTDLEELNYLINRSNNQYLVQDKTYRKKFMAGKQLNDLSNQGLRLSFK